MEASVPDSVVIHHTTTPSRDFERKQHLSRYSRSANVTPAARKAHLVETLQRATLQFITQKKAGIRAIIASVFFVAFTVYFAFAVRHSVKGAVALIVISSLVAGWLVYRWIRDHFGEQIYRATCAPAGKWWDRHWTVIRWFAYGGIVVGIILYLSIDVIKRPKQLQSLSGMVVFFLLPLLTCKHPKHINWRPVIWGMVVQFVIGCLVLRWRYGYQAVEFLSDQVSTFLGYSLAGGVFLFSDPYLFLHPFITVVVPLVIFLGCVTAMLYYWGFIPWVCQKIGWLMSVSFHTTAIESASLVVNIFLSVLDVIIMLKRYIPNLTASEFHCFIVGAHSTLAGFAFGLIVLFGVSPQHLLTGAVMSAPAAVALAKLNFPETEESMYKENNNLKLARGDEVNVLDAAVKGGWAAGKGVMIILGQTVAFVGLYSFLDAAVLWLFARVDVTLDIGTILGYIFIPFAFLMGVDMVDLQPVGQLLGLKVTANEIFAYLELGNMIHDEVISRRSAAIATYAMCGFSSFSTLVIMAGVWLTVDATKTVEVTKQIPRIMMNSNLSCFMTACIASILYDDDIDSVEPSLFGQISSWFMGLFSTPFEEYRALFREAIRPSTR